MPVTLPPFEKRLSAAVAHYWKTLSEQSKKQKLVGADRGRRADVTGGKQMDGFCELVNWILIANGAAEASIYVRSKLELPGYFRPTKKWDMLVVHEGSLLAAMEFKSQRGPSFGNNLNNRVEEAVGNATDLWTAYREGAFGEKPQRPFLGWVMLLEDHPRSAAPVAVDEPHFDVMPVFRGSSYAKRYEVLLRRLKLEKMYDAAAYLLSTEGGGKRGEYREPAEDLTMRSLLASLAGHVSAYMASRG